MNLQKCILTKNECYTKAVKIKPCGIMVHSTGCNNPWLKRYVGPDDGKLGKNPYNNHWNAARPGGQQVCVHAFIGKLADGSIATYQTLPWDIRGWHSGYYSKNSTTNANKMGYIGFEICEDGLKDKSYLDKVYREAVELCAYLCKTFNLDPTKDGVIICHKGGNRLKIASNHEDVEHWWPNHGKSMTQFRSEVAKLVGKVNIEVKPPVTVGEWNAKGMWDLLRLKGFSEAGTAAIMGNAQAESGLIPTNLQNSYESRLGFTDSFYTAAVDSGKYQNFVRDKAGYGLLQWTYWSRKEGLLKMAKNRKVSVGDGPTQVDFMIQELKAGYKSLLEMLKTSTDVDSCTRQFLLQFEKPADMNNKKRQDARVAYAMDFFRKFATGELMAKVPYCIKVSRTNLNIRVDHNNASQSKGFIKPGIYTVVEEKDGPGATLWGKLKSGVGWVALDWVEKL